MEIKEDETKWFDIEQSDFQMQRESARLLGVEDNDN